MVFNSGIFLVFFALFFPLYWVVSRRFGLRVRNFLIIAASYLFYGWWDYRFLSLIFISSVIDFAAGLGMGSTESGARRKAWLWLSMATNLGILGFFKYFNFFSESLQRALALMSVDVSTSTLDIVLPVGISFYTFQTMSYTIDVYRGNLKPTRDVFAFFAFVAFFPQLVAGPIERASHLLGQFHEKFKFSYDASVQGLRLMLWGFFMKVVIADNFGVLADKVFNPEVEAGGASVWVGAVFFALQIYADFAGYSSIAIGLSRMLGFDLMTNFRTPYLATSFTDFWRRWHISLSTWFRDYVYIPLGGNRGSQLKVMSNTMVTFLLSGFWHGANITYLVWGGLHGAVLIGERKWKRFMPLGLYPFLVLIAVILFWIPFRAAGYRHLQRLVTNMLDASTYGLGQLQVYIEDFSIRRFIVLLVVMFLFVLAEFSMRNRDFNEWMSTKHRIARIAIYYTLVLLIIFLGNFSVKPNFIYFQF